MSGRFCTEVTPQCPVEATTYGYYPNLGGNIFLCIVFSICALLQLGLGIKYKLRAFGSVATISCAMEAAGYGGRLLMHQNPWSSSGFKLQIVLLILAPSFLAAGIYLTLKHLAMVLGRENSRLPPRLYTWIFIGFDAVSILTQAAGGGLAASTGDLVNIGDKVIITGIAIQVATMAFFYAFSLDFALRVRRNHKAGVQSSEKVTSPGFRGLHDKGFRFYLVASAIAFTAIFIRCVYRYVRPHPVLAKWYSLTLYVLVFPRCLEVGEAH